MAVHVAIRKALRQVMFDKNMPPEAQKQAEDLLAALHACLENTQIKKPSANELDIARLTNKLDTLWKMVETAQMKNLEHIHTHGMNWYDESNRLTAETAIATALAELKHRENIRLVEELEQKRAELG